MDAHRVSRRCLLAGGAGAAALAVAGCGMLPRAPLRVDGVWVIERATLSGTPLGLGSGLIGAKLTLKDGQYEVLADRGVYQVLPGSSPFAMDVEGRQGPNQGRKLGAIFRFEADHLDICYDLSGKGRPSGFESPPGSQWLLVRYLRDGVKLGP